MAPLLKNLYNEAYLSLLTSTLTQYFHSFDEKLFFMSIYDKDWKNRELKARMHHIANTLGTLLPNHYEEAIKILKCTFSDMNFSYGLENMIFQDFVAIYGHNHFTISMDALAHFTVHSSSEFAIRTFLLKYPQETMQQMQLWAKSQNEHHRRLASEGCRPRLPWATQLPLFINDPSPILVILELLKEDTSKYVQKSVANNLNDISKDNPKIVIKLLQKWIGTTKQSDWILKHGARTLLKNSNREVLQLFGFHTPQVTLTDMLFTKEVKKGTQLDFSFTLHSAQNLGKLRIEYAILFLRKNRQHNKKVFHLAEGEYIKTQKSFHKSYSFKPITTRNYYEGEHTLQIIINGTMLKEVTFFLT